MQKMSIKKRIYEVIASAGIEFLQKFFPEYFARESVEANERWIEFPFALQQLPLKTSVLDVGCTGSMFPFLLKACGHKVTGIDQRPITMEGIRFVQEDIRATQFPPETFDCITAISTIEHIGLKGIYGNAFEDIAGDVRAVNECYRILKPKGKFIMTVPYGNIYERTKCHRIYDKYSLATLLMKFKKKEVLLKKAPKESWDLALIVCIK